MACGHPHLRNPVIHNMHKSHTHAIILSRIRLSYRQRHIWRWYKSQGHDASRWPAYFNRSACDPARWDASLMKSTSYSVTFPPKLRHQFPRMRVPTPDDNDDILSTDQHIQHAVLVIQQLIRPAFSLKSVPHFPSKWTGELLWLNTRRTLTHSWHNYILSAIAKANWGVCFPNKKSGLRYICLSFSKGKSRGRLHATAT